jgi:hypothetical protein
MIEVFKWPLYIEFILANAFWLLMTASCMSFYKHNLKDDSKTYVFYVHLASCAISLIAGIWLKGSFWIFAWKTLMTMNVACATYKTYR